MKKVLLGVLSLFVGGSVFAQTTDLFISEYAEGSSNNKYIEIFNGTGDSVNLANYELWRGSNGTPFPGSATTLSGWIQDGDVLVVANSNADAAITSLPNATTAYNSATFFNGDDAIGLAKDNGSGTFELIDAVGIGGNDPGAGWNVDGIADATANHTIIRKPCVTGPDTSWTVTSQTEWTVFPINTWTNAGSHDTVCSSNPTPVVTPTYLIEDVNNVDANGIADSLGVYCWVKGVVLGVNMSSTGLSFTIWDNEGLGVFNGSVISGYNVSEGDSVLMRGTIDQFAGLTQINPDSIQLVNSGNVIPTPTVITDLNESTESELVRFENVLVESITPTGGSGTNYVLVSGMDTLAMRVDNDTDVDDSLTFVVGDSLCYVIGIGSQRDFGNPALSGYQFFPRTYLDIDTTCGITTPPNPSVTPTYPIADINNVDAITGEADSLGVYCWTKGVVMGVNMNGNGLSFTIWDNEGMGVYSQSTATSNYTVAEGDSVIIRGTVDQFRGLTQINPDSIQLVNSGNTIPTPTVVTELNEITESELVRVDDVLVTEINGSNYTLVSGMDTLVMRIDSDTDVDDSLTFAVGDSLCYVIGIGGQFDFTSPYTTGYQMFPRYYTDIDTTCGGSITPPVTPEYEIADINNVDADGVADSNGVYCWTEGVVLGVNMRPSGLQFTIWDVEGIGVFNNTGDLGYTVAEGDLIRIKGTVSQFNGLTQINPDEIVLVSSNNSIPVPEVVSTLSEDTESELVRVNNLMVAAIDSSSSAINYALVNGNDTITMRVDLDTDVEDVWSLAINDSLCYVIGIGGQFDNSNPFTSGYQLFPRTSSDLDTVSCQFNNVEVLSASNNFAVYPNPVSGSELFFNQVADVTVYNTTGSVVMEAKQVNRIAVDQFKAGVYIIRTANAEVVRVVVR